MFRRSNIRIDVTNVFRSWRSRWKAREISAPFLSATTVILIFHFVRPYAITFTEWDYKYYAR